MSARSVALVGMPGCGKSTVGPRLAERLALPFVELDARVEQAAGRTVAEVFAAEGEAGFRRREREALAAALARPPAVIATGGGVVKDAGSRALLERAATVWLRAGLPTLERRTAGGGRPLLEGGDRADRLARLLAERRSLYAAADLHLDGEPDAEVVADRAARALADPPRRVAVGGSRPYAVLIGAGLLDTLGERAAAAAGRIGRAALVTDQHVNALHGERAERSLAAAGWRVSRVVLEPGEGAKSWAGLQALTDRFAAAGLTRGDLVVALGGGVVGDLAGLAAALWMRGVAWVQVPTTLLAQVDSSVGGKTAIDTAAGKNLVGAFHPPSLVLADLALLRSLPARELRAGWAEVLKHGLLGDAELFARCEAIGPAALAGDAGALAEAVARSVALKAAIVTEDERETAGGRRALLNLGHTFGHALEAETGFGPELLHGEAVAVGCVLALRWSARQGLCPAADAERAAATFRRAGLPAGLSDLPRRYDAGRLIERMQGDKKAGDDGLTLVIADGIGRARIVSGVDPAAVRDFLLVESAV